jgi:hypothetical protein
MPILMHQMRISIIYIFSVMLMPYVEASTEALRYWTVEILEDLLPNSPKKFDVCRAKGSQNIERLIYSYIQCNLTLDL